MEVVKCGLCKEELEYSQRCRVYIKSNEPRPVQRSSTRPHIGRYKLISTASSTEHISFLRRLKRLDKKKGDQNQSADSSLKKNKEETNTDSSKPNSEKEIVEKKETSEFKKPIVKKRQHQQKKSDTTKKDNSPNKVMSHPHFQSSFEEYIKPSLSKNPSAKITKNSDSDTEVNRKSATNTPKTMKNGKKIPRNSLQEFETYYWLDIPKPKAVEVRKLGYPFENLVTEVKHMKLPSSEWKIKIMVHKQEMVSVSFSNKQTPEKIISVNAKNSVCDISIDNKKLILLGSPVYIFSIKDLEILLDIMNDIDPSDSMIHYL